MGMAESRGYREHRIAKAIDSVRAAGKARRHDVRFCDSTSVRDL